MPAIRILILCLFLSSCLGIKEESGPISSNNSPTIPDVPKPTKELNVGFLVTDGVFNSELMAPYDIFHHTKFRGDTAMKVFTVAESLDTITTFEGLKFWPDYTFENHPPIHILVVPSAEESMGSDLENEEMMNFVKTNGEKAEYILSLCDGAFVLAAAGLLDGLHATTFPGDIDEFEKRFKEIDVERGYSFVHHGKAITSSGGAKSYDPSLYLVEMLYGNDWATETAEGMVIDWDPKKVKFAVFE